MKEGVMRSWIRTRPRWLLVLSGFVLAAAAIAVPVALASDLFTDVPDSNPFHNDIGAIARAGITQGKTCEVPGTVPTYCPTENVTREAMAAFMHRGFGRVAEASDSFEGFSSGTDASLGSITLTPGLPGTALAGAGAFIKVDVTVNVVASNTAGCPCVFWFQLVDNASSVYIGDWYIGATVSSAIPEMTVPLTAAYRVTGTAPRQVNVVGRLEIGTGSADVFWEATAAYFPFGAAGTDTLSRPGVDGAKKLTSKAAGRAAPN
jgi:hypothetical protein